MDEDEIVIPVYIDEDMKKKGKKEKKLRKNKKSNSLKKNKKLNSLNYIRKRNAKLSKIKKILIFLFVVAACILLLNSNLFDIKNIEVLGNENLSKEKIIEISGLNDSKNLFQVRKKDVAENLKQNAYIENVRISKKIPNTICIEVTERNVTFMIQFSDSYVYINNQGYMLEISNNKRNVPIIVGFTTDLNNIMAGNRLSDSDLSKMNDVIKLYEVAKVNSLNEYISKIDISDETNYVLEMESKGKKINLGDCSDYSSLNTKMLYLYSILQVTEDKKEEIFLNVNLNNAKVYSRPMV